MLIARFATEHVEEIKHVSTVAKKATSGHNAQTLRSHAEYG